MSKVYETLKKKTDPTVEVYPNIETQNIPDDAITTAKIVDNAITTAKILDGNVTKDKLATLIQNIIDICIGVFDEDGNIDTEDILCQDLKVTQDIDLTGDLNISGHILDSDGDYIQCLKRHSIVCNLRDTNNVDKSFQFTFLSSNKEPITTFNELINELESKKYINVYDLSSDVTGNLSYVDINSGQIGIHCYNGSFSLTELDFVSLNSITDTIYDV